MTLIKRLVNSNLITRLNNIKSFNQVSARAHKNPLQKIVFLGERGGYVI